MSPVPENNYNRDVYNGDLGVIEKINRIEQVLAVDFEGRSVEYDFGDLDELALAYVLSIHRSQGSEFPCVVIPLHTQHSCSPLWKSYVASPSPCISAKSVS